MKNNTVLPEKVVTIRDIAKIANVSIGTVSRVFNGKGYISKETKKKVESAIVSTGYIPNVVARSMVKKNSFIVGIVVPEINNPFHSELVTYVNRILNQANYSVLLCNSEYDSERVVQFINELIQRNAEGLMLISTDLEDASVAKNVNAHLKTVGVCAKIKNMDCINLTDWQGAFDVTEHFISLGHQKIACVGVTDRLSVPRERLRGYQDAMRKHGLDIKEEYIKAYDGTANAGYNGTLALMELRDPPTAIFFINDFYAINAYSALLSKGVKIGKDIMISGFDDLPISNLVHPTLTSVRCDIKSLAELSADTLLQKLHGKEEEPPEAKNILFSTNIVKRESTMSNAGVDSTGPSSTK